MQSKLFVGIRMLPELSELVSDCTEFQLIPYEGKKYIGVYLPTNRPTLQDIRHACSHLVAGLQAHCPHLRCDTLPIVIFPQLFLG